MEPSMYDAIVRMKKESRIEEINTKATKRKEKWEKRLKLFSLEGSCLLWNEQRAPTQDELDEAVRLVQEKKTGSTDCMSV